MYDNEIRYVVDLLNIKESTKLYINEKNYLTRLSTILWENTSFYDHFESIENSEKILEDLEKNDKIEEEV